MSDFNNNYNSDVMQVVDGPVFFFEVFDHSLQFDFLICFDG